MSKLKRLRFTATLVYDAESMHGDDAEAKAWFFEEILGGEYMCLRDNGDLGDEIGQVTDFQPEEDEP